MLIYEIKKYFHKIKSNSILKSIIPENSKYLWRAVKKVKDILINPIPKTLLKTNGSSILWWWENWFTQAQKNRSLTFVADESLTMGQAGTEIQFFLIDFSLTHRRLTLPRATVPSQDFVRDENITNEEYSWIQSPP